ncbi:hypothetical protein LSTR_LSTR007259 [Laodelphax striatellus]|uniref:Zinc finger CCHC domain-containing protein 7 n=1 Tax=Laodelphax striatellus TaxID=195883 RepID=A0A482XE82_LAOST|nr:hypothetical protein LSTR_LSTR007259 [Laodelphax striatellus]
MEAEEDENSTEDSAEQLSEIEARLYSIVHYNDLSKPLDESITAQYDIEVTNDQQIIVSLKGQPGEEIDETSGIVSNSVTTAEEVGGGSSAAKIQKLSGDENVANVSNLDTNESGLQASEISKEGGDSVVVVTIENSDGKGDDDNNQTKTNSEQRISNAIVADSTNSYKMASIFFNGGITPASKKKKKKKKSKKKKANEIIVDLTSDNDDFDCQVIVDDDLDTTGVGADDSLVLNIVEDDEIIDDRQNNHAESRERNVDGVKNVGETVKSDTRKVGRSGENASESLKKAKLTKKQKKAKLKVKRRTFHCPKKWTASMVKYYCKTSKRLANFDHVRLIRQMKASNIPRDKWAVSHLDKTPPNNRFANKRCDRCRQFGHVARFCIEPVKPLLCHMCGEQGHRESRCPERRCLNCGTPSEIFVEMCSDCHLNISNGTFYCEICYSRMHRKEFCPNLWRAFHMTTKDGPLIVPHTDASRRKNCSNCGGVGHIFHECEQTFHITPFSLCAESPIVPDYSRVAEHFALLNGEPCLSIALQLQPTQYQALAASAGCAFLQALSDKENVTLRMETNSLTIEGKQMSYYPVCSAVSQFLSR